MAKSRISYLLLCLTLVLSLAGGIIATQTTALAQSPTPAPTTAPTPTPTTPPPPVLTLTTEIPSYSDVSGASFSFDVTIKYDSQDRQTASLSATTTAPGWSAQVVYSGKQVNSVDIGPSGSYGPDTKSVQVTLTPPPSQKPDPGNYVATLKVTAANVTKSIDLTGVVKAKYSFGMTSDTGRLSTSATAGKDNHFAVTLTNSGSAQLSNITFTSDKPDNWTVKFSPEKVDSIAAGQNQQVDVTITPPDGKTIAGDYMVTLHASNDKVNSSMDVRVTALTPSIWGWVGIIIIVVVVAGLAVLFLRLGRR